MAVAGGRHTCLCRLVIVLPALAPPAGACEAAGSRSIGKTAAHTRFFCRALVADRQLRMLWLRLCDYRDLHQHNRGNRRPFGHRRCRERSCRRRTVALAGRRYGCHPLGLAVEQVGPGRGNFHHLRHCLPCRGGRHRRAADLGDAAVAGCFRRIAGRHLRSHYRHRAGKGAQHGRIRSPGGNCADDRGLRCGTDTRAGIRGLCP